MKTESTIAMPLPADWVFAGDPSPRGTLELSLDMGPIGRQVVGEWECGPGRFRFRFDYHETVRILDGGVVVTHADGRVQALAPGDFAYFAEGSETVWEVADFVRKAFFIIDRRSL